jgi:hypothetical protein
MNIYEIIDATTHEIYWTLGVWYSLPDALAALDKIADPGDLPDARDKDDDFCRVEIRERQPGWNDGPGKLVHTRAWDYILDEEADEFLWRRLPDPPPAPVPAPLPDPLPAARTGGPCARPSSARPPALPPAKQRRCHAD